MNKQTKLLSARAINVFMKSKALSVKGKMLIRNFRSVSLRGEIKNVLGALIKYVLH